MSVSASELYGIIREALPDAAITLQDLAGDGTHYAIGIVCERFRGMSRVRQHGVVAAALRPCLGHGLRAVSLMTSVPNDTRRLPAYPSIADSTTDFGCRGNKPIVTAIYDSSRHAGRAAVDGFALH